MARYESVLDLIGDTPMVDVSALSPNPRVTILAKLEGWNPGGSVKDRAAKAMVEEAEKDGSLRPGQQIIESSSGNTGIALAMIAKVKGYPIKIVLPENVSPERRELLETWGAEIIDSPGSEGSNGAMRRAQALAVDHPEWWFPYQYGNPANPKAHYEGTGPEIWRDCPEITHFVAGLGTAGTLMGVARFLKERDPLIQVWAVQPPAGEMVDGLKNLDEGFIPPVFTDNDGYELLDRSKIVGTTRERGMDPAAGRCGGVRRDLVGRHHGRRRQVRRRDRRGRDRHHRLRRRLEVPLDRSVDRRRRRGHGEGQAGHLLLSHPARLGFGDG